MKRTGMKRSLDRLGRIVLPKEMRDTMEIHIGDPLEFFIEGKELILRKYKSTLCIFAVTWIRKCISKSNSSAGLVQFN